jgi:hypothetical protein
MSKLAEPAMRIARWVGDKMAEHMISERFGDSECRVQGLERTR